MGEGSLWCFDTETHYVRRLVWSVDFLCPSILCPSIFGVRRFVLSVDRFFLVRRSFSVPVGSNLPGGSSACRSLFVVGVPL